MPENRELTSEPQVIQPAAPGAGRCIRRAASTAVSRPGYAVPHDAIEDVRGMTYHAFTATSQASDDYLRQRALPRRLTPLGKPLLVIFGSEDRRWQAASADDYRTVPGAVVELLPGIGHSPILEDPPRTAASLLAFVESHFARAN